MAKYLWQSFVETITPGTNHLAQEPGRPLNHTVGDEPLTHEGRREVDLELVSKATLEHIGATDDPIVAQPRGE